MSSFLRLLGGTHSGSRFRQNFLGIARANMIVQALSLALAPLLTRLYSPSDFGTAALFVSLLGFVSAFATLRFEWSVPNAAARNDAVALIWLSFGALLVTAMASLLMWVFASTHPEAAGTYRELVGLAVLFPVALVGAGLQQILLSWYTRENDLTVGSKAQLRQGIAGNTLNVAGGLFGLGALGLTISTALSSWAGLRILARQAPALQRCLAEQSRAGLARAFRQYVGESLISSVVSLISVTSIAIIPFLLVSFFGPTEVGWYALMNRLALAPTQLFTNALARSFWSEAASLVSRDLPALRRLYLTTARRLAMSGVPIALLCACGPFFVAPVFGEQWHRASYILLALAPGVVSQLIAQPITHLIVHRKQHWKLYLDGAKLAANVTGVAFLAARNAEIQDVVWFISAVHVLGNAALFSLNLRCLSRPPIPSR